MTTRKASERAYQEAGITRPREALSLIEVHDCFSITEVITMEDLYISPEGEAVKDVMDGFFDADGPLPCQIDGGLKCFGHPIGASGLRMIYEVYLQMLGRGRRAPTREGSGDGAHPQPRRVPAPERLLGGDRWPGRGLSQRTRRIPNHTHVARRITSNHRPTGVSSLKPPFSATRTRFFPMPIFEGAPFSGIIVACRITPRS